MLAVAAAAGLALVAGWLPALVTVVTVATPSAVLWRTHQHTNPAVIDTARPSLELVS